MLHREGSYHQWRVRRLWVVPSEVGLPSPTQSETAQKSEEVGAGSGGISGQAESRCCPPKGRGGPCGGQASLSWTEKGSVADFLVFCSRLLQFLSGGASASVGTPEGPPAGRRTCYSWRQPVLASSAAGWGSCLREGGPMCQQHVEELGIPGL